MIMRNEIECTVVRFGSWTNIKSIFNIEPPPLDWAMTKAFKEKVQNGALLANYAGPWILFMDFARVVMPKQALMMGGFRGDDQCGMNATV